MHTGEVLTGPRPPAVVLDRDGAFHDLVVSSDETWSVGERLRSARDVRQGYLVNALPVEMHCHSLGSQDFSRFEDLDLHLLDREAAAEGVLCLPTLYLPYSRFPAFLDFMDRFATARTSLTNVIGIALEGPLLASFGGTPEQGVWVPTLEEWRQFAASGPKGLLYIVISPDGLEPGSCRYEDRERGPSIEEAVEILITGGVRPALGHFHKRDPAGSAKSISAVIDVAKDLGAQPFDGTVITDHLFNDMPSLLRYAWRTPEDRLRRDHELPGLALEAWNLDQLEEIVGPVPATLMRQAVDGWVTICLNFDGEHVDHEVARRAVELVGAERIMVMSDRSDVPFLGGQRLTKGVDSGLWYQAKGVVAAGSTPLGRQMDYLADLGFTPEQVWAMSSLVAHRAFALPPATADLQSCACSAVCVTQVRRSGISGR